MKINKFNVQYFELMSFNIFIIYLTVAGIILCVTRILSEYCRFRSVIEYDLIDFYVLNLTSSILFGIYKLQYINYYYITAF